MRLTRMERAVRLVHSSGAAATAQGAELTLIRLIVKAREWWARMIEGDLDPSTLAAQEGVSVSYVARVLHIAFLALPWWTPSSTDGCAPGSTATRCSIFALSLLTG